MMDEMKKITRMPTGWPTDNRTKRADFGKWIVIVHPERQPHKSVDGKTWQKVTHTVGQKTAKYYENEVEFPSNVYLISERQYNDRPNTRAKD